MIEPHRHIEAPAAPRHGTTVCLGDLMSGIMLLPAGAKVWFDFGWWRRAPLDCYRGIRWRPGPLHCYRGDARHLALTPLRDQTPYPVRDFMYLLDMARRRAFQGWQGGTYRMTEKTPVWVDNQVDATTAKIAITGVRLIDDDTAIIITRRTDSRKA